ncbi:MAG: protein kinase, partial [Chthoniobacterales bacterium]
MQADDWRSCTQIFDEAVEVPPGERDELLTRRCAGNDALRRKVELLLRSDEQSGDFIETPAFAIAPELFLEEPDALLGQYLGQYRVESVLGVGGMGVVYCAQDERLGRKVALKLLPPSLVADASQLERLKQEARTASGLNHPNIVTIHEIGQVNGTHYIATELIEGITLRDRIGQGPVAVSEALDTALQVARALSIAHSAGIVHRDIKPENIMLRPDGYVKVLDFGIATYTRATVADVPGAKPTIIGTARYMSPEQARGLQVDARTDIWSLGVVVQELVTGESPFAGATVSDTIANILEHEPPPLAARAPDAQDQLQRIINRALQKKPEARYQTSTDLLADLEKLKQERELAAHHLTGPRILHSLNPPQRLAFVAFVILLFAAAAIGLYKFALRRGPPAARSGDEARPVVLKTTQITTWPGLDTCPAISPDGSAIAYTSDHSGSFELYVKQLIPGARELQLTLDAGPNFDPAWSPDGKLIAYSSKAGGIWIISASGGAARQLTKFGARPRWSPDDSRIAFQSAGGATLEATSTGLPGG